MKPGDAVLKISLVDHGLYYKGLLILIRRDRQVDEAERRSMLRIGAALGFERSFCEQAIREILENRHIDDEPPRFSDRAVAPCFIRDGIRVATAGRQMHEAEVSWLRVAAGANGLDQRWFDETMAEITDRNEGTGMLEAEHFRVA